MKRGVLAVLALIDLAACAGAGRTVDVTPMGAAGAPRPPSCPLEILYQPPSRPYEAIANLTTHLTAVPAGGAPEALRGPACELGADAVIVTRNQVLNVFDHTLVEGTAIRYTAARPAPSEPDRPAPSEPDRPVPPDAPVTL